MFLPLSLYWKIRPHPAASTARDPAALPTLNGYSRQLAELPGASEAKPTVIPGRNFAPSAVIIIIAVHLEEAVPSIVAALLEN